MREKKKNLRQNFCLLSQQFVFFFFILKRLDVMVLALMIKGFLQIQIQYTKNKNLVLSMLGYLSDVDDDDDDLGIGVEVLVCQISGL